MTTVNWDEYEVEEDIGEYHKWDLVPEGEYAAVIYEMESKFSRNGDPMLAVQFLLKSANPKLNNTVVRNWFTFSPRALPIAKRAMRNVLGAEAVPEGKKMTGKEFVELVKQMRYENYPNDNEDTAVQREMLVEIYHRSSVTWGPSNTIAGIHRLPESWEEPTERPPIDAGLLAWDKNRRKGNEVNLPKAVYENEKPF